MAEFQILGPVVLRVQGRDIDLHSAKIRGLLGILLLSPDTAVSVDQIVDRLWDLPGSGSSVQGREPPANPPKTLQSYVSKLRTILDRTGSANLVTEHGHYRLSVDRTTVDYYRFRALAERGTQFARQGDHRRAVAELSRAVDLWRARPLADVYSSWASRYAETMRTQDLLPAYQRLVESHLELGDYEKVLSSRRSPIGTAYETDEILAGLHMRALAKLEGPAAVKNSFAAFTRRLREVAESEPSEWLEQLYRRLQNQTSSRWEALRGHRPADVEHPPPQLLPRDVTNFVGRGGILADLDAHLTPDSDQPAVVSLYGAPGVGKTALVLRWAHSRRHRFPDGILYADLNGYGRGPRVEPSTVVAMFLQAMGLPAHDSAPGDLLDSGGVLRRALTGRRALIVLDNVLDDDHVQPLLAATAPCPLLITSRRRLEEVDRDTGAHTITVATLLIDDATALLERRIGGDRARGDLSATHSLAALCGGLPLALQVASEYVAGRPDTPLRDLVEHLGDKQRVLDAGGRTLGILFDLSADSLSPEADRLYQLIGLHPSSMISTAAAAAITAWHPRETEFVLDTLVRANLIEQQQDVHSYQLHDLLHMHAGDRAQSRLADVDRHVAERRMADWYLLTAINAEVRLAPWRPSVPPLPHTSDVEPMTFRDKDEAMRWCLRERSQVMAVARYAADTGLHHHVWRLVGTFVDVLNRYGDPRPVIAIHRVALDSARAVGARDGEAGIQHNLGSLEFRAGRFDIASQLFQQALTAFRELGDESSECMALFNLANSVLEKGSLRRAVELHQQSLAIAVRLGDRVQQARIYLRLGDAQHRLEHPDLAVEHLNRARTLLTEVGDERGVAAALTKLAEVRIETRDITGAAEYCEEALEIDRKVVDARQTAAALRVLAHAKYLQGLHDEAITDAQESVTLCQRMHDPRGEARSLDTLAVAYHAVGDRHMAQGIWRNALALCKTTGDAYAAKIAASLDDPSRAPR